VIERFPVLVGGLQVTVACSAPAVAVPIVGAPGGVAGRTAGLDAAEAVLGPTALLAVTVNV